MKGCPTFVIGAAGLRMENGTAMFGFVVKINFIGRTNKMENGYEPTPSAQAKKQWQWFQVQSATELHGGERILNMIYQVAKLTLRVLGRWVMISKEMVIWKLGKKNQWVILKWWKIMLPLRIRWCTKPAIQILPDSKVKKGGGATCELYLGFENNSVMEQGIPTIPTTKVPSASPKPRSDFLIENSSSFSPRKWKRLTRQVGTPNTDSDPMHIDRCLTLDVNEVSGGKKQCMAFSSSFDNENFELFKLKLSWAWEPIDRRWTHCSSSQQRSQVGFFDGNKGR